MAPGDQQREKLVLEDFEVTDGEVFDPVTWLNARLSRNGDVVLDRLDQHLSLLGMSCQLLCQETSESIEASCNQLVSHLPGTTRDLERIHQEALAGRARLAGVLDGLQDAGDRKRSGLQRLAEIDSVKSRVETACSALREIGSWERRVRDCEQLVSSGGLPAALAQLNSLREVLDAFRMLPEYSKKEEQLQVIEASLLKAARRKARLSIERCAVDDLNGCCEVLTGMGKDEEIVALAETVFQELAIKVWNDQGVKPAPSGTELGAATKAVFDAITNSFEERREVLRLLDDIAAAASSAHSAQTKDSNATHPSPKLLPSVPAAGSHKPAGLARKKFHAAAVSAARASLVVLGSRVEACIIAKPSAGEAAPGGVSVQEGSVHVRSARAMAALGAYVDGIEAFSKNTLATECPDLVADICHDDSGHHAADIQVLPWNFLKEVVALVVLVPMQDDASALLPAVHSDQRPSDAVLAAESSAMRMMQMAPAWAQRLKSQGIERLSIAWLACIDEIFASYWKQWNKLFEVFKNTLEQKGGQESAGLDAGLDSALLNECLQLHSTLHDTVPASFSTFRSEALQLAARMAGSSEPAFGRALASKFKDPASWSKKLGVPSVVALDASVAALLGTGPSSGSNSSGLLPLASASLANAESQARDIVTRCCVQPVTSMLAGYPDEPQWACADVVDNELQTGLSPLRRVTTVGEHLFSLVPQLETSHDGSHFQWLPVVVEAVVEMLMQRVLHIKRLTLRGAAQLTVDLEYVLKVTRALGSEDPGVDAATSTASGAERNLAELLELLGVLSLLKRRKQESLASGEPVAEAPRDAVASSSARRFERPLRAALGLERSAAT